VRFALPGRGERCRLVALGTFPGRSLGDPAPLTGHVPAPSGPSPTAAPSWLFALGAPPGRSLGDPAPLRCTFGAGGGASPGAPPRNCACAALSPASPGGCTVPAGALPTCPLRPAAVQRRRVVAATTGRKRQNKAQPGARVRPTHLAAADRAPTDGPPGAPQCTTPPQPQRPRQPGTGPATKNRASPARGAGNGASNDDGAADGKAHPGAPRKPKRGAGNGGQAATGQGVGNARPGAARKMRGSGGARGERGEARADRRRREVRFNASPGDGGGAPWNGTR
jgi:hypothetical protein